MTNTESKLLHYKYGVGILQLNTEHDDLLFRSYDEICKIIHRPERHNYDLIYTYEADKDFVADEYCLNSIWERFNIALPPDFTGHSLSVSDIIIIKNNDKIDAYYVDTWGFKYLENFNINV